MKSAIAAARLGLLLAADATRRRADDLSGQPRAILVGADVRPEGRVSRRSRRRRYQGDDQRRGRGRRCSARRPRSSPTRTARPQTAYWIRGAHLATAGRHTVEAMAGADKASVSLGRLRDARRPQGEERHPVHRRRPVDGAPHRGAHPVEGHHRRPLRRRACDRRHALYGAGLHLRHRHRHHRQRQLDERLHDRPQVAASTRSASTAPATKHAGASRRWRPSPSSSSASRHGCRRRHQHRDRGCNARRHGGAYPPALRLRRHRAHVLQGSARRHNGRRSHSVSAQATCGKRG